MKHVNRTRVAAATAAALAATAVGALAIGTATAATEPVGSGLPAPSGLTPNDTGSSYPRTALKSVRLDWAPVAGATGYRVQVGRDGTWSDDVVLSKDVVYSEYTLPLSLPNASYVWRVAALKGSALGHWSSETVTGDPSATSDPTFVKGWRKDIALDPVADYVGVPTFSWAPVSGADAYQVQVSTTAFTDDGPATAPTPDATPTAATDQPADSAGLIANCFTTRTTYTPAQDVVGKSGTAGECLYKGQPAGTPLYWRVRALDAFVGGASDASTAPVSHAGISYAPPVIGDDTPADLTQECPTAEPTVDPSADPSASPAPAAEAFDCDPSRESIRTNWSYDQFTSTLATPPTADPGPLVAAHVALSDGLCAVVADGSTAEHATCSDVPTLTWAPVSGATVYRVTVGLDEDFTNIRSIVETPALQWTLPGGLADSTPQTSYYYAVQACSTTCGQVSSTPASFRKVSPRLTVGARPGKTGEFTLSWQALSTALAVRNTATAGAARAASQDAYAYHVQVATDATYSDIVDDVMVDQTYLSPSKSYGDGDFVWRVQAVDNAGDKLPFSLSQAFTRDATPPKVLSVSPSAKVSTTQPLKLTFSETVTGLSSSTVTLSPSTPTTLSIIDGTHATLVPARLVPGTTYTVVVGSAVKDLAGNSAVASGPTLTVNPFVESTSKAIALAGSWKTLSSSNASGGSYLGSAPTTAAQTSATVVFRGTGVALTSCLGPANGNVAIYVDGVKKSTVSLYRSFSGCGVKVSGITGLTRGLHTYKVVGTGTRASASKGTQVAVDAVTVTP